MLPEKIIRLCNKLNQENQERINTMIKAAEDDNESE